MGAHVTSVSRGLLRTEARVVFGGVDPEALTETAILRLQAEPVGGFAWKEKAQWARRLAHGNSDFYGRRIFSDAGKSDCRYVARVARRAWKKGSPPKSRREWGNLRAGLGRIFTELQEGL